MAGWASSPLPCPVMALAVRPTVEDDGERLKSLILSVPFSTLF